MSWSKLGPGGPRGYHHGNLKEALIRAALESRCSLAVLPMQDLLGLDSSARMNVPGQATGQWQWQFAWPQANHALASRWRQSVVRARRQPA